MNYHHKFALPFEGVKITLFEEKQNEVNRINEVIYEADDYFHTHLEIIEFMIRRCEDGNETGDEYYHLVVVAEQKFINNVWRVLPE